eukprot:4798132-Amphidinium_carterae.3
MQLSLLLGPQSPIKGVGSPPNLAVSKWHCSGKDWTLSFGDRYNVLANSSRHDPGQKTSHVMHTMRE